MLQYNIIWGATADARASLVYNVGWFEWRQGRCEAVDTLNSISLLVTVLQLQGNYMAVEEMGRRVPAQREKVLGLERPDTLSSANNLALILLEQGNDETAEEMNR